MEIRLQSEPHGVLSQCRESVFLRDAQGNMTLWVSGLYSSNTVPGYNALLDPDSLSEGAPCVL